MMRIKIPQGIVTRAADARAGRRRRQVLARVRPHHDAAEHPVPLRAAEGRGAGDARPRRRPASPRGRRAATRCETSPRARTPASPRRGVRRHAVRRGDDALLPAASARRRRCRASSRSRSRAARRTTRWPRSTTSGGTRASSTASAASALTIGGGTSILPVSGYLLYEFLPAEQMLEVAEAIVRVYPPVRRLQASPAQPHEVPHQGARVGGMARRSTTRRSRRSAPRAACGCRCDAGVRAESRRRPTGRPQSRRRCRPWRQRPRTPVHGPGIVPGTVRLQTLPRRLRALDDTNVGLQRQAGYCHVTVRLPLGDFTAGQMRVLADLAEAYGDGTVRLTIGQNVLFRWVKKESRGCVLPAARGRRARRAGCADSLATS